jgi:TonB-linked SusC/RagA family outer membrane protein
VIDGIPIESGEISTSQPGSSISEWNLQQAANTNVLASLNPADIESIEILKDAAAAAIYGSRGANGVVLINTKTGKSGEPKITFSGSIGLSDATHRIGLLNSSEYLQLAKKAWYNSGNRIEDFWSKSGVLVDGLTREEAENTDTDWIDETLQVGLVQDYNISVSGGNDKTTFFISANFKDQETILRGNKYRRLGTRLNIDHKLTDNLKIGGKMMLTNIDDEQVPTNWAGGISNVSEMLPIWPVRKPDGTYFNLTDEHPVAGVDLRDINLKSNQILGNWYVDMHIIEGLTFRTEAGTNLLFNDDFHYRDGRITDHSRTVSSTVNGNRTSWNWKNILNYKRSFGKHNFDFLAATEAQALKSKTNFVFGDTFINSTLTRPNDAAIVNAGFSESEYSFLSYIGRVNYDLKGKYLLSASLRADGSSRFAADNRWGYFPAISLGWILSEEAMFESLTNVINFFKIRASYGQVGNAEIGDFTYVTNYGTSTYNSNTGISIANLGDANLGWETTSQFDVGITWELFNGRVSGEIDFYDKTTTDLLLPFPVSQMTGVSSVTKNVGELNNRGVDIVLNTHNISNSNFSWETNFTFNYNKNEVIKLGDELIAGGLSAAGVFASVSIFPGFPVGVQEGVVWAGVDRATGEDTYYDLEDNLLTFSEINEQYGSFDNFVNDQKEPIGNPWPKYTGGIDNRFSYKNFYANVMFTFATGQEFSDGYMKQLHAPFGGEKVNPAIDMLNAWNAPGDDATVSRLTTNNVIWPNTTEFLYRTDYLRLRDLTIGYRVNLDNPIIKGFNIYTKLTNILTFTKAPDFFWDPEFTGVVQSRSANNIGAGGAFKQTPQAKSFLVGFSVDF